MPKEDQLNISDCPLCHSSNVSNFLSVRDFDTSCKSFQLIRCSECGLTRTTPVPTDINSYYPQEYYGESGKKFTLGLEKLTRFGNFLRARKLFTVLQNNKSLQPPYRILDIGCGRAALLHELNKSECECHGLEREGFQHQETDNTLHLHYGDIEKLNFKENYFDLIIIWHVLEHLDDPFTIMGTIHRILKPGGLLVISVPNFSGFQSSVFKSSWFHLDIPRHLYHFDVGNLSRLLKSRNLDVISLNTCSLEQGVFGFIQSVYNKTLFLGNANEFYRTLKKNTQNNNPLKIFIWSTAAILLLPLALIEYVISCTSGNGAVISILAKKPE